MAYSRCSRSRPEVSGKEQGVSSVSCPYLAENALENIKELVLLDRVEAGSDVQLDHIDAGTGRDRLRRSGLLQLLQIGERDSQVAIGSLDAALERFELRIDLARRLYGCSS